MKPRDYIYWAVAAFALALVALAPSGAAQPEVRDLAGYSGPVTDGEDYWTQEPTGVGGMDERSDFATFRAGAYIELVAPDGEVIRWTCTVTCNAGTFYFDGSLEGPSHPARAPVEDYYWVLTGDPIGRPVDGSWTHYISGPVSGFGTSTTGEGAHYALGLQGKQVCSAVLLITGAANVGLATPTNQPQMFNVQQVATYWEDSYEGGPTYCQREGGLSRDNIEPDQPEESPDGALLYRASTADCSELAGSQGVYPAGPPVATDADGDGVPGYYTTPQEEYTLNADCSVTTAAAADLVTPGPDPDDDDAGNPGASCTPESYEVPTGTVTPTDADGDGLPGSYSVESERYDVDASCNVTQSGVYSYEVVAGPDTADDDPNDPNPGQPNPTPFTGGSTVACADSVTVNGAWARGVTQVDNTWGRFAWQEGVALGEDLRLNPFVEYSPWVDLGAAFNGTHSAAIDYNNAAGTSYQLLVRNGSSGPEQAGVSFFAAPSQCTLTGIDTVGLDHVNDKLEISVSQAQCSGDPVAFTVVIDDPLDDPMDLVVAVYDESNTVVLTWDDTDMNTVPTDQVFHYSALFPYGSYSAVVTVDSQGLLSPDFFDAAAFNVPFGTCLSAAQDFGNLEAQLAALQNSLSGHRDNSFEVFGMEYTGQDFGQFVTILFWLIVTLWLLTRAALLPAVGTTIVFLSQFIPGLPWTDTFGYLFLMLTVWVHMVGKGAFSSFYNKKDESE